MKKIQRDATYLAVCLLIGAALILAGCAANSTANGFNKLGDAPTPTPSPTASPVSSDPPLPPF